MFMQLIFKIGITLGLNQEARKHKEVVFVYSDGITGCWLSTGGITLC